MTITIETPADLEEAITQEAAREGLTVEEYTLRSLLLRAAPARAAAIAPELYYDHTDALFDQWAKEDATDDPEELARRQREGDEFIKNLQANRLNIGRDPELLRILEITDDDDKARL